ncbi:MAG TPA: PqqD family protein [Thermodesulfovibrionales bacterium]|jgi:hypothetical protein|nr:PqqD family protein [Thermodesulfovibrionales bacterium]
MTEGSRFRINSPKVIHETIDGETVLVHLDSGNYYSLDGAGADIWGLINRSFDLNGIIEWIAGRYRADRGEIEEALNRLMSELQREDLIVTDEGGGSEEALGRAGCEAASHREGPEIFVHPVLHKYTDMQDLLLLDPIHDVDETGWPSSRDDLPVNRQ